MGYLSYGYKASKTPIGKKVVETVKNIFTKKNKVSPDIKSVKPSVPKTKLEKAKSELAIAKQKTKASGARLKQTLFDIKQKATKRENKMGFNEYKKSLKEKKMGFNEYKKSLREKKMGGGMMGRRFGMKKGSGKKFPDLTGDGKVTFADILKGRGVINGKKKKKKA